MSKKGMIIKGAFILTFTGFLSRFIGFFYRIFLSQVFGEEGVGLYQLIFPIYALAFSLTSAGIETALSRCVAHKISLGKERDAKQLLYVALSVSLVLSCVMVCILQSNAAWIALHILGDSRCEILLITMSYAFPFSSLHSCICGYYFGRSMTGIPASSQLVEQTVRVGSVYILYLIAVKKSFDFNITIAVFGLVLGEAASSLFALRALLKKHKNMKALTWNFSAYRARFCELIPLSLPLTANRILLNILQSIEAISIPSRLKLYGMTSAQSLGTYGVLTGMAIPLILFPSAITNSISTMMLPAVAEVQAARNHTKLITLIRKVCTYCFLLGVLCCILFLLTGSFFGRVIFGSAAAGEFIVTLAWICPFQYVNTTLVSIINGLGKTTSTFAISTFSLLVRIGSVFYLIPIFGILGYLWGLLGSQLAVTISCLLYLRSYLKK